MITSHKEVADSLLLASIIKEDSWVDPSTIIVNCSPDYSSILCQIVNHNLSSINSHELFEVLPLEMPYPTMSQVWDGENYLHFERYLLNWVRGISSTNRYLFLDSGCLRGKNFSKVKMMIKDRLSPDHFRFGCLYLDETSIFNPDYYVEVIPSNSLIFWWENPNNPNWNY